MNRTANFFFLLMVIAFVYQMLYYSFFFIRFLRYRLRKETEFSPAVSVIIAARNEAENLKKHLPLWLNQQYENYELILIDDRSEDGTKEILAEFKDPKLKIVEIRNKGRGAKKQALTAGIHAAQNEYLLFTDADCRPASKKWIARMAAGFEGGKNIVLGYGKYEKRPGWLNKLIRYETVLTGLQYFGYALRRAAYMGVGRNLAYSRKVFHAVNGFAAHADLLSGDDDLLVNKAATPDNTAICIHPDAHTNSLPETNFKDYFNQKFRHYSTSYRYRLIHRISLFLFTLTQTLFWISAIYLLFNPLYFKYALFFIMLKSIVYSAIIYSASIKLEDKIPFYFIPFLELNLIIMQLLIFVKGLFKKNYTWH